MNKCDECGLPISACNAIAMFRRAIKARTEGADAKRWEEMAEEFYQEYLAEPR
jgi:hypothetical protein